MERSRELPGPKVIWDIDPQDSRFASLWSREAIEGGPEAPAGQDPDSSCT